VPSESGFGLIAEIRSASRERCSAEVQSAVFEVAQRSAERSDGNGHQRIEKFFGPFSKWDDLAD